MQTSYFAAAGDAPAQAIALAASVPGTSVEGLVAKARECQAANGRAMLVPEHWIRGSTLLPVHANAIRAEPKDAPSTHLERHGPLSGARDKTPAPELAGARPGRSSPGSSGRAISGPGTGARERRA